MMEVPTEATEVIAEEKLDEDHRVTSSAPAQKWREYPPQNNQGPDNWQQKNNGRRNNRGQGQHRFNNRGGQHHQLPGFGRGIRINRNEQEQQQYNDNYRESYPRANTEGNRYQRYDNKNEQFEETPRGEMRANHSGEGDNQTQKKSVSPKHDERESLASDIKDKSGKNACNRDNTTNREGSGSKETRDSGPQVPGDGRGNSSINHQPIPSQPSKDNLTQCVDCGHKNILAKTEFIKTGERIKGLEKENLVFRKEREALMTEIIRQRLMLDALQAEKTQEVHTRREDERKREGRIDSVEKENCILRKERETLMIENTALLKTNYALILKLDASHSEQLQKVDIDLKSLWASIEEVADCPICLELLKPPVTLCVNGHGTCCECRGTLTKCPTCRQPYSNNKPRVLNKILQKIPKVCKYYDEGCREPAKDDHELYCMFRKVKCIFHDKDSLGYCNWEGPAHEFEFGHVYDTEHLEPCSPDIVGPNTFKFRKFKDPYPEKSIYDPGSPGHKLFVFTHVKINGNLCLYFEHIPLEKPKVTTYFKLSFVNSAGEILYQYTLRATTKTTLEREVNVDDNVYCMRVPLEELEKLVDEDGDLCVNCGIKSEPLK